MPQREQCAICDGTGPADQGQKLSARDLAGMQEVAGNARARALRQSAVAITVRDQPAGTADRPTWWVCGECMSTVFSVGEATLTMQRPKGIDAALKQFPAAPPPKPPEPAAEPEKPAEPPPAPPKKKWSFWK